VVFTARYHQRRRARRLPAAASIGQASRERTDSGGQARAAWDSGRESR
jgi:hypothetical protein